MLARPVVYNDGIEATELVSVMQVLVIRCLPSIPQYPMRKQADDANQRRLNALSGTTEMYVSRDVPG